MDRLLGQVIHVVTCTTQNDVNPCRNCIREEDYSCDEDEVVVPTEVSSKVPGPHPQKDRQGSDNCKSTDYREGGRLSVLDHSGGGRRPRRTTKKVPRVRPAELLTM